MTRFLLSLSLLAGCGLQGWPQASCTLNSQNQTVTICAPVAGATGLTPPVHVNAGVTDTHAVSTMWIYLDGVKVFFQPKVNFIDTSVAMSAGQHRLVVQAQDSTGLIFKTVETVTVGGGGSVVTIAPSSAALPEGGQEQFKANVAVTWSATCGTIDDTGLYTSPAQPGSCTVQARDSLGDVGTASVTVLAPGGVAGYLTWKNDNTHTGQQRNETTLTPANVNSKHFGKKFSVTVDGYVFAQPLYVANLTIDGKNHNVVYVATEHDSVYAFDADAGGAPLWHTAFLASSVTTVPAGNVGSTVKPEVGITGTPVIDADSNTLYVVAETLEKGSSYVHRLHALDLATGAERTNSPVVVSGDVFHSKEQLQRGSLLLANGQLYFAFGSQGDTGTYQGWVFAYDPSTLAQTGRWNSVPTGSQAGVWMAGAGPAMDSGGNLYVMTGNGTFNPSSGDFGDSLVKLGSNLSVLDYFTPFDQAQLDQNDGDFGSGGPMIVPDQPGAHPHELIACGKLSAVLVLDRENLGQFHAGNNSQIIQSVAGVGAVSTSGFDPRDHCFMTPAFWEQNVYFVGNHDAIKAFHLDPSSGLLSSSPTSKGTFLYPFPGAQPVVSSSGPSNGIVWAVDVSSPATLHAYDATNVSKELYNSNQAGSRDTLGTGAKFVVPTVVNGKVYVGGKGHLTVYGLL
jgi:hypothetical protein